MTTKELYTIAYRRVRVVHNIGKTSSATDKYEALQPIAIPFGIISAARASYTNRKAREIIDPCKYGEYFD